MQEKAARASVANAVKQFTGIIEGRPFLLIFLFWCGSLRLLGNCLKVRSLFLFAVYLLGTIVCSGPSPFIFLTLVLNACRLRGATRAANGGKAGGKPA